MEENEELARLFGAYAGLDRGHRQQVVWLAEQLLAWQEPRDGGPSPVPSR